MSKLKELGVFANDNICVETLNSAKQRNSL